MTTRVAVLTPFAFPSVRGNAVTVERIVRGLESRGVDVRVWDLSQTAPETIEAEVHRYRPAVVHAFHAYRVGPLALRIARRAEVALVVTLTGTDANHDLFDPDRALAVRRVLEGASAVIAFHDSIARRVTAALPDVSARLAVVPQAAVLGTAPFALDARWPLPAERVLFVFAAGVRPVKRPRFPLAPLGRVVARHPAVRLLYAGPVFDAAEGGALLEALETRPWARHVGVVPHGEMASLLTQADVALNCSISEGGMANSVLEALTVGRAVLASDIDGNRSLIEHDVTGLLFRDEADFAQEAERLVRDPALRARLGRAGRERVAHEYPPERELDGHLAVYRRLVPVSCA